VRPALAVLWRDARLALFARKVLPLQLLGSLALVLSYIAVFYCCARAIGVERPAAELLPLIPPVLLAFFVYFHRRRAEQEGVDAGRLRYGKKKSAA
jgi:uncharacterized protein involved in response to NO